MSYLLAQASAHRIPLRSESVQTCVTSPPYWGLRAYAGEQAFSWGGEPGHAHEWGQERRKKSSADTATGLAGTARPGNEYDVSLGHYCCCGAWYGALGLEPTPELYVEHMVEVFRDVRRVLRKDGTLWLNIGDSYAGSWGAQGRDGQMAKRSIVSARQIENHPRFGGRTGSADRTPGLKPKDLVGIPWRVAFALQADGWYLRSDIVWAKPNPMPESVTDRPTKSHEYVFLLAKSERYFYDADAIREVGQPESASRYDYAFSAPPEGATIVPGDPAGQRTRPSGMRDYDGRRNARSVWNIATQPYPGAHFATFPEELPERCIKAGSAAQACGVCGAPWERVTEREGLSSREWQALRGDGTKGYDERMGKQGKSIAGARPPDPVRHTTGFQPTCTHEDGSGKSVVFDPFNGSGTTGRVALRLGRRYVGLDLSREYLSEQALRRVDPLAAAARDAKQGGQQVMAL